MYRGAGGKKSFVPKSKLKRWSGRYRSATRNDSLPEWYGPDGRSDPVSGNLPTSSRNCSDPVPEWAPTVPAKSGTDGRSPEPVGGNPPPKP